MSNYGAMQTRIADEIGRSDLPSEIALAIQDSVAYHQRLPFFSNRATATFNTVQGTQLYPLPTDLITLLLVTQLQTNETVELIELTWEQIQVMDVIQPPLQGKVTYYALFNKNIRMYLTPDNVYATTCEYLQALPAPVLPTDGNNVGDSGYFWMNDAERVIRTYAKHILYSDIIREPNEAQGNLALHHLAMNVMEGETYENLFTGTVIPTSF